MFLPLLLIHTLGCILFCSIELLITVSDKTRYCTKQTHYCALRLITGAGNSTHIAAMQLQTKIYSLSQRT